MSDAAGLLVAMGTVLVAALAAAAWYDVKARRRGSKLVSGAVMARAIKDAKREARATRGRRQLSDPGGTRPSGRPSWDDREG